MSEDLIVDAIIYKLLQNILVFFSVQTSLTPVSSPSASSTTSSINGEQVQTLN